MTTSSAVEFGLSSATAAVLSAIRRAGGRPLLVGGCVRDALLAPGSTPKDVDVEVFGLAPADLRAALAQVGRVDEVGRSFAVLKVRRDGEDLDVAVPAEGPGTRPEDAARRRDFTVNALMVDPVSGEVLDAVGGLADLRAGVLRHTGPSFTDDPLRVLRGVRFAARFGFAFAPETAELCRTLFPAHRTLPVERVWGEWRGIGERGRDLTAAVAALVATGWIAHVPQLARLAGVPQDPRWHPEGDVLVHSGLAGDAAAVLADGAGLTGDDRTVVVLGALLHDLGKATRTQVRADGRITSHGHAESGAEAVQELLGSIGAPPGLVDRVVPVVREHMVATSATRGPSRAAVRRLARRLAPASLADWSLVCGADHAGRGAGSGPNPTTSWLALAEEVGVEREPARPLLRGADLIALGHEPGPCFRGVMAAALAAQDEGLFTDRAGAVAWLAELAADGRLADLLDAR
ncbi:tRNA nucleotidyltransferase (CCA-adding enzyme) [Klenkia soli]|uniref:tRNA nucleotidyltransferase (CCA-adding enzyme) n=1 Tax=Klenkia soli TaxID=1052260 RepID=A0A1H0BNJ8_9ACTN|nr:HD domain-containing protein [Klenkia soli]SDN47216.1 tRNA nucleotidyltransferase (CCA-adding enzyme) [Klenkia soli]